jgi:hypothetical protein
MVRQETMDERDLMEISLASGVSLSTCRKWSRGKKINAVLHKVIDAAVKRSARLNEKVESSQPKEARLG